MDYNHILKFLLDKPDFEAKASSYYWNGEEFDVIEIIFFINNKEVKLLHFLQKEFFGLPPFYLYQPTQFGQLAHVGSEVNGLSGICVNNQDSVSVNFECPELAFYESIQRHIALLTQLISDENFNRSELLREFQATWYQRAFLPLDKNHNRLSLALNSTELTRLALYQPIPKALFVVQQSHVAIANGGMDRAAKAFFECSKRKEDKDSISFSIPLGDISPFFDNSSDGLKVWLCGALKTVSQETNELLHRQLYNQRAKQFWLVLNFPTPSGISWIGIRLVSETKKSFPQKLEKIKDWQIEPVAIDLFNQELVLPRGGASLSLHTKKVMLVGCGSVGGEVAHKLASAGVGHLTLVDPDFYSVSNLYRHRLGAFYLNTMKALAMQFQLQSQFPWIKIQAFKDKLLECRDIEILKSYDLIVVAIGSPTHERLFHDYLSQYSSSPTVIYTWLEGYGIGGHAVLDIAKSEGCLRCAYVEPESGRRGLASNLNFFKSDQSVVKNYAGCGEMYIPYGAIHSTQTAIIAADLAVRYLEGKIDKSTKVSWKGDADDALAEGIELTSRFDSFKSSLKKLPLKHPLCDCCNSFKGITFKYESLSLTLSEASYHQILRFRQIEANKPEAAGLLIGYKRHDDSFRIELITEPKPTDIRQRSYFKLDAKSHQQELENIFEQSERVLGYLGTWHTHPELNPSPSTIDTVDWGGHKNENPDRQLFFVIAGIEHLHVYTLIDGKTVQLKRIDDESTDIKNEGVE